MIYDVHCHPQWQGGPERLRGGTFPTPEEVTAVYERLNITAGLIMPLEANEHSHDPITNRVAADIEAKYPGTFCGHFCYVDPRMMNHRAGENLSYYLRFFQERGAVGLGEMQAYLPLDDARYQTLCACAGECGMPVTFHFSRMGDGYGAIVSEDLHELADTLNNCPGLIVIAHAGGFWKTFASGIITTLFDRFPNLRADLAGGAALRALSADKLRGYAFLNAFGDRILFGTDLSSGSSTDNAAAMLRFLRDGTREGHLSKETYEQIVCKNAQKLFHLP